MVPFQMGLFGQNIDEYVSKIYDWYFIIVLTVFGAEKFMWLKKCVSQEVWS